MHAAFLRHLPGPGLGHQDRQRSCPPGCWSRPRAHRSRYLPGKTILDRWELARPAARLRGDAGNRRLHARWDSFDLRRKRTVIADVAIARELAAWCLAVMDE